MEKFSNFRDAGTGIQPFLTPVPPSDSDVLARAILPLRYVLGLVRTVLVVLLALAYVVFVHIALLVVYPMSPLYDLLAHTLTAVLGRLVLFMVGILWIQVDHTTKKRKNVAPSEAAWNPKAGDLIVSNWVSWVELIWLAIRFNPIFVLPLAEDQPSSVKSDSSTATPIMYTPGRRTGTGSANINQASRVASSRVPIAGFKQVSLLQMIGWAGHVPSSRSDSDKPRTLEDIRKTAKRPVVVFPECTTSNGRGLLRFANVFNTTVPVKGYNVFVMCVRYDPPTTFCPSLTHSLPSTVLNPLAHVFSLASSLSPLPVSIRLLALSDSPSSQLFMANEYVSGTSGEDQLTECCATLISQIGRLKQTGMRWEDKAQLLDVYLSRTRK